MKLAKNIIKGAGIFLGICVVFFLVLLLYFNSEKGQKTLGNLVFDQLSKQIGTPVSGTLSFSIPDWVNLENLLLLDQKSDTLIYSRKAHLDVALFELLDNKLNIEKVELEQTKLNVSKQNKAFNFDYIIQAFQSPDAEKDTNSLSLKIQLKGIDSKGLSINYTDKDLDQSFRIVLEGLQSGFEVLDIDKAEYGLKSTKLKGLTVNGKLGNPAPETGEESVLPNFWVKQFEAENVNWNIDLGEQTTSGNNTDLALDFKKISLPNMQFELNDASLNAKSLIYFDKQAKPQPEINFSDLALSDLKFELKDILYKPELALAQIVQIKAKEKSGLEIKEGRTKFKLEGKKLALEKLLLSLNGSLIEGNAEAILDTANFAKTYFEANVQNLKLAASDALFFSSDLAKNETFRKIKGDVFTGKGKVSGTAEDINVEQVYLTAPKSSHLTLSGKITNKKILGFDLQIKDFVSNKTDINKLAGPLPETIDIPQNLRLNGTVKGNLEDIAAKLSLKVTEGLILFDGRLKNLSKTPIYDGNLKLQNYALGKLIKNQGIGDVSAILNFSGRSFDNPALNFDGVISEAVYDSTRYQNLSFKGTFADFIVDSEIGIDDEKAKLSLYSTLDIRNETPEIKGNTSIERLNLNSLGLTTENIILSGNFDIKELKANLKQPYIDFVGQNVKILHNRKTIDIGKLNVLTEYGEVEKSLVAKTDFMNLSLSGNFEYDKLQGILLSEVNKYFKIPDFVPVVDTTDFHFNINGNIKYHPVFTAFVPALKAFEPLIIKSELTNRGPIFFSGLIDLPFLQYDSITVEKAQFNFEGNGEKLQYKLATNQVANPSYRLRNGALEGSLRDNLAGFALSVKDSSFQKIHSLAGILESDGKKVRISFDETGTMLFYKEWGGNPYGYIDYSSAGLVVNNVVFSSGDGVLRVNTADEKPNAPLSVFAEKIDLNTLAKAIIQDSTIVAGQLDMNLEISDYLGDKNIAFTGDVFIDDFAFSGVELGKFNGKAESENLEKINVVATLRGLENNFDLSGAYSPNQENALDFKIDMDKVNFTALEPFLEGILYDMVGKISGAVSITGAVKQPQINGRLELNQSSFRIQETGAIMKISEQVLAINDSELKFDKFVIRDSKDEKLTINGKVSFKQLPDFNYNLNVTSDNFLIAESEKGQSELFYGTAYLASKLNIKGKNTEFRLTGDLSTNEGTNLTLLLPDESYGADLNSVVTFVDFRKPSEEIKPKEKTGISFANAVNINLAVDKKTTVNILMNAITGDMLSASGNARLNLGFDNVGDLFIVGSLDIEKGSYEMTYQAIRKRFEITPTSKSNISFTGDPMKGLMDITAEYLVPGKKDFVKYPGVEEDIKFSSTEKVSKIEANTRVDLVLGGEVMNPDIAFRIAVYKDEIGSSNIEDILEKKGITLLNEKGEATKEDVSSISAANKESLVQNSIMLLVSGNFTASQMIESFGSAGEGAGYEDLARRNASQLISSQLEKYASGLIKGVDLDLGLQSSGGKTDDGSNRSTNLNLGLRKRLANDRLEVSVGKNFELENKALQSDEVFDNLEANWLITRDGRYKLKVFRKTQNQSAVEGSVVETGFGFSVGIDYDTWREIFNRKR